MNNEVLILTLILRISYKPSCLIEFYLDLHVLLFPLHYSASVQFSETLDLKKSHYNSEFVLLNF